MSSKSTKKPVKPVKTKEISKIKDTTTTIAEKELINWMNLTGLSKQLVEEEKIQFIKMAQAFNLNPFKKEIFCNVYNADRPEYRTLSIVIGYPVFLKRAERLTLLDGWGCQIVQDHDDMKAVCTIYRKDWKFPFQHEAWLKETMQCKKSGEPNSFWKKMPKFMLKKVCISQAFRLCFPDELGEYPYTDIEMGREYAEPINVTPKDEQQEEDNLTYDATAIKQEVNTNTGNITGWAKLQKFVKENQKEIMAKNISPSDLFKEARGKSDEEIDQIIEGVKIKL